ncbi:MAG: Outer membrane protein assembly factor BamB [Phycisphaerae bacterium]|nr:Outer membrane protein assembly factor BamB [Phycisphaerae bacterium]
MSTRMSAAWLFAALALLPAGWLDAGEPTTKADTAAGDVIRASGIRAGLCVHVGETDGRLTAELGLGGNFIVHGLAENSASVDAARQYIRNAGLYGRVSVEQGSCDRLPYAPDTVSLLVVTADARAAKAEEIARVLAPDGVVCFEGNVPDQVKGLKPLKSVDPWTLLVKPRPEGMDDFTHFNYDASCNRVGQDRLAEVPFSLRWLDGPDWTTSYSGPYAMVSAGGRLFTAVQEAYRFSNAKVDRIYVTARDAYNGKVLWKKPAPGFKDLAAIAAKDAFYTVLDRKGPLVALDAVTGRELRVYKEAGPTDWAVLHEDRLIVNAGGAVKCVAAGTGRIFWQAKRGVEPAADVPNVAVDGAKGEIYFLDAPRKSAVVKVGCLDLADGREKWCKDVSMIFGDKPRGLGLAAYHEGVIVIGEGMVGDACHAFSAKDGGHLWTADYKLVCSGRPTRHKGSSYVDGYFIDGLFWVLAGNGFDAKGVDRRAVGWHGYDPRTGQIARRLDLNKDEFINDSCHRTNASIRYFLGGHADFVERATGRLAPRSYALHNGCHFGMIPANGLWYTSSLYLNEFVMGEAGLAGRREGGRDAPDMAGRLEKGPGVPAGGAAGAADWPCFRANALREGASAATAPEKPEALWAVELGGNLGPPTAAAGKVFVADLDGLRVMALDAADGKVRWNCVVGGRVHVPPTYHDGMVLFGCADGWVYALNAGSGELIWRYRAAPALDRIIVRERLESVWPVLTGVLVLDGVAVFAAGRHGSLDGGVEVYGVEPATGRLRWHKHSDTVGTVRLAVGDGKSFCLGDKSRFTANSGEPAGSLKVSPFAYNPDQIDPPSRIGPQATRDKVLAEAHVRAVARAGGLVLTAGPPLAKAARRSDKTGLANYPEDDLDLKEGEFCVFSADGRKLQAVRLDALPVFDGLCAAGDKAFLSTQDGKLLCFGAK